MVQPVAMQAWEQGRPLLELAMADPMLAGKLSREEIEDAFDLQHHMAQVDVIFARVGLV